MALENKDLKQILIQNDTDKIKKLKIWKMQLIL